MWLVGVQIKQDWPGVDHFLKPDDEKNYTILPFNVLNFPQLKKKKKEKKTWDKITEILSILSEVQFVKDTTVKSSFWTHDVPVAAATTTTQGNKLGKT